MSPRADASRRIGRAVNRLELSLADRDIIARVVRDTPGGWPDLPQWLRSLVEQAEAQRGV